MIKLFSIDNNRQYDNNQKIPRHRFQTSPWPFLLAVSLFCCITFTVSYFNRWPYTSWFSHYQYWLIELVFLLAAIFGLLYFKSTPKYIYFLMINLILYCFCQLSYIYMFYEGYDIFGNNSLLFDQGILINKVIISGFSVQFLVYFYCDASTLNLKSTESVFFTVLVIWAFLFSLMCFDLFILFIIMEMITLCIIVAMTLYINMTGSKFLQPILYFFIINVMMATFYVFGCTLQLYLSLPSGAATVGFTTFLQTWEMIVSFIYDVTAFSIYTRLVIGLILLIFFFKLTLAPFSIWVNAVYKDLPFLFLCLLMTIYKIFFIMVCLTLIFGFIDIVPEWHSGLVNLFLFILTPSLFVGCLAFRQREVKTMLALTTVSQFGYIAGGFITSNPETVKYSLLYLYFYCLQIFVLIGVVLILKPFVSLAKFQNFVLVQTFNKWYAPFLFAIFFNLAGVPPMFGFFLKYGLFIQFYNSGFYVFAVLGLLSGFIMTILYLQIGLQLCYPVHNKIEAFKIEHKKRVFLQTFKNNMVIKAYAYLDKNFLLVGVTNIFAAVFMELILIKMTDYAAAVFYRLSSFVVSIVKDTAYTQSFKEEDIELKLQSRRERQLAIKWHPKDVYPIIDETPRLRCLIDLELQGALPEHINASQWLNEFASKGVDYSSFILAQTQLDWHKTGGVRLKMEDFEPFFKREKPFSDLVLLIEQHAGPYNLWSYEPCVNLRHFHARGAEDVHHHWHQTPHNIYKEPLIDFNQFMDIVATGQPGPTISWHHQDLLVQSVAKEGEQTFDTNLLWYHIDQEEFRVMCEQLVNCKISYTQFVHFLVDHGMGWAHYAHLVPHTYQPQPWHISDWIQEAHLAYDAYTLENAIQEHYLQHPDKYNVQTAQHINHSLKHLKNAWKEW